MRRTSNLTIGTKLYGSFGLLVALLAALTGTALWSLGSLGAAHGRITGHADPLVLAAEDVRYDVRAVDAAQTAYVLDRGRSRPAFEQAAFALDAALGKLERLATAPADRAAAQRVASALANVFRLDGQIWQAVKGKDFARAEQLHLGSETQAIDATAAAAAALSAQA